MVYLLDANVFIEAKNRYYAFDICPGFWDWMDAVVGGQVMTIRNVRDELNVQGDDLGDWIRARHDADWFLPVDDELTQTHFAALAASIDQERYHAPGVEKFLSGADPWLIAKAKAMDATIVTHEVGDPHVRKRVPIPNMCDPIGVTHVNTFDFLRALEAKFHLR